MDGDHHDALVGHRKNEMDDRNDLKMVVNLLNRNCVRRDRKMDENSDVSHGLHMNDLLYDLNLDVNLLNRNYAPRDLKTDGNLGAMSRRVMLMDDPSKSCDRMSHDHLRCDHQMMRHRDMNRMDEMNLDGKMKIHHVIHQMKVYPKTDDRMKI